MLRILYIAYITFLPGKPLKMNEFLKQEFFLCPHMPYDDLNPVRTNMGQFLKIALLQPTPTRSGLYRTKK